MLRFFNFLLTQIFGIAILVALWTFYPARLTELMDLNLEVIRFIGDLPNAERAETALRLLAGEKMFLLIEVVFILRLVSMFFRSWVK